MYVLRDFLLLVGYVGWLMMALHTHNAVEGVVTGTGTGVGAAQIRSWISAFNTRSGSRVASTQNVQQPAATTRRTMLNPFLLTMLGVTMAPPPPTTPALPHEPLIPLTLPPFLMRPIPTLVTTTGPAFTDMTTTPSEFTDMTMTTPAPTQRAATAAPAHRPATAAPTHRPATAAPAHRPATAAPTQRPATAAPAHRPATAAPTHRPATPAPTLRPATLAPTLRPATLAPTHRPATAAPTLRPATAAPTLRPATAAPTLRPATLAPTHRPATLAPAQRPATLAPAQRPATAAPAQRPATAAPALRPATAAPAQRAVTPAATLAPAPIPAAHSLLPTAAVPPTNALGCRGSFTSNAVPASVHFLRVGDVKVLGAMGDSVTTGNGAMATNVLGVLTQYRGRSFSIGGDNSFAAGVSTLPNIFKEFNPNVYGFSVGAGGARSAGSNLNVATAGASMWGMPSQAVNLVNKIRSNVHVNYTQDWKVITLSVGGNNLCNYCKNTTLHSAASYKANIEQALDILHANMPRTLVNVVEVFDVTPVTSLAKSNILCRFVINSICPCGVLAPQVNALKELTRQYQMSLRQLIATGKYDTRPDFTVVVQPFFRDCRPPRTAAGLADFSYFAPDCFHFSSKGQSAAGKALWNNMLQPLNAKQTDLRPNDPIACPTTNFIPTRLN